MSAKRYMAVLRVTEGPHDTFIPVCTPNQARGIRPQEVWIFGVPTTTKELVFANCLAAGHKHLRSDKVHYSYFD